MAAQNPPDEFSGIPRAMTENATVLGLRVADSLSHPPMVENYDADLRYPISERQLIALLTLAGLLPGAQANMSGPTPTTPGGLWLAGFEVGSQFQQSHRNALAYWPATLSARELESPLAEALRLLKTEEQAVGKSQPFESSVGCVATPTVGEGGAAVTVVPPLSRAPAEDAA